MLPEEVNVLAVQVSENKQNEVKDVLNQIFTGTDEWEKQVDAIEVKDVNDTMSIKLADTARKNAKNARLNAEKLIDAKRQSVQNQKAEFDLEDKLWLKTKQVMQLKFKAIEEKAEWKSNFVKRFESEQKEVETQRRVNEVSKYAEINRFEFENMSIDSFDSFLSGLKTRFENEKAAAEKAESDRIKAEKAELARQKAIEVENAKLKAEADKAAAELAKERAEAKAKQDAIELKAKQDAEKAEKERQIEADKQKSIQAAKDAEIAKERKAREKLEAEAKAAADAELASIAAEKKAATELAKAPIKNQLSVWVSSFELPQSTVKNELQNEILAKFDAFKKWSLTQINNL